jgi:hypothetical protein
MTSIVQFGNELIWKLINLEMSQFGNGLIAKVYISKFPN